MLIQLRFLSLLLLGFCLCCCGTSLNAGQEVEESETEVQNSVWTTMLGSTLYAWSKTNPEEAEEHQTSEILSV
jgi:hypothetical protein